MIEGTLGTRIKLSPLTHPGKAAIETGGGQSLDEAGSDPESIDGMGVDLHDDTPLVFLHPRVRGGEATMTSTETPTISPLAESRAVVETPADVITEPPAMKFRVEQVEMVQMDEVDSVHNNDFDVSMFQDNMLEYQQGRDEDDGSYNPASCEIDDNLLWLPRTGEKPVVNQELLSQDSLADQFEIKRFLDMGVLIQSTGAEDSSNCGSNLIGKYVRILRKKERDGQPAWYHRSPLVTREYNYLFLRKDTFSPASNSAGKID